MRLINADALVEKLKKLYAMAFAEGDSAYHSAYRSLAKIVEDASTVGGWIPVSDGLPETSVYVLATTKDRKVIRAIIREGYTHDEKYWFHRRQELPKGYIVAWMPLPEPYREDGEA